MSSHTRTHAGLRTQAGCPAENLENDNNNTISGYPAEVLAGCQIDSQAYSPANNQKAHAGQPANTGDGWTDIFFRIFKRQPDELCHSDVAFYLKRGMSEDVIKLAICATRDAKKPTWKYTVMIMKNCYVEGIFDIDGFLERSRAYYQQQAMSKSPNQENHRPAHRPTVPAQMYEQREYTREQLYALFEII